MLPSTKPPVLSKEEKENLFRTSVLLSIFVHVGLWGGFYLKNIWHPFADRSTVEIDLTKPFRIGGNPLLKPGGGTTEKPLKNQGMQGRAETVTEKKSPPKDWVLPGPNTKVEKPIPETTPETSSPNGVAGGTGDGYQGTGGGWGGGDGQGGGIPLSRFPELLNKKEILKLLRKFYPAAEREAGIEGIVVVDLHLDQGGTVQSVDVVDSAGLSFDQVAQMVSKRMRFSPAMVQTQAVAVKIRQSIRFKLEDE